MARDIAALATAPAYDGVTGAHFMGLRQVASSVDSHHREYARDLWETSERLIAAFSARAERSK